MTDLATALAASMQTLIDERCEAIRAEAEKVIEAFREHAARIAAGVWPAAPTTFATWGGVRAAEPHTPRPEPDAPIERVARVRSLE